MIEAISDFKEKKHKVKPSELATLIRIWPKETDIYGLKDDPPGEGEEWDKAESYFVRIAEHPTIEKRLKVWKFEDEWDENKILVETFFTKIMNAYKQIESNPHFLKMTSYALAIGNILNGGTPKG